MLSYLLRTFGMGLDATKVGPKGTRIREYRLDDQEAAETHRISRARRTKLMAGATTILPTPQELAEMESVEVMLQGILEGP